MKTRKNWQYSSAFLLASIAIVALHSSRYLPDAAALTITVLIARLALVFGAAVGIAVLAMIYTKLTGKRVFGLSTAVVASSTALIIAIVTTLASLSNDVPEGLVQLYLSS